MITANVDRPPSHLCDGLIECQNGRRASIGNYSTAVAIICMYLAMTSTGNSNLMVHLKE